MREVVLEKVLLTQQGTMKHVHHEREQREECMDLLELVVQLFGDAKEVDAIPSTQRTQSRHQRLVQPREDTTNISATVATILIEQDGLRGSVVVWNQSITCERVVSSNPSNRNMSMMKCLLSLPLLTYQCEEQHEHSRDHRNRKNAPLVVGIRRRRRR